jgi:hypothetical protein
MPTDGFLAEAVIIKGMETCDGRLYTSVIC